MFEQGEEAGGIGDDVTLYPLVLEPDRPWLYERCDLRFAAMLEAGAIAQGPVASIRIPTRLRPQVHGWWVSQAQLDAAE